MKLRGMYFYGNKVSEYGLKNGFVDYGTLAKAFDAVLVNDITKLFFTEINGEYNEVEQINGFEEDPEADPIDIYQYYIVSDNGARLLEKWTNEIVFYVPLLDCYVWGVTHFGTSWDYVLTEIAIESEG